jgi:predicted porin
MKSSHIAMAALAACSGAALAQSSVTISGFIDQGVGKSIGTRDKAVQESAVGNSRIAFRGVEDLGGGFSALFGFEHRLRPDLGTEGVTGRFWSGYSTVGLRSRVGTVTLGRQYTAAYSLVQGQIDPFGNVTVANLRDIGMRPGAAVLGLANTPAGVATVSKVRVNDSIRYDHSAAGFNVAASIAEATQEGGTGPDRPWSVAANYSAGPLFIAAGYENPQFDNDHQWNLGVKYTLGPATLIAGGAYGRTANDLKLTGALVGLNYRIGGGDLKVGYGRSEIGEGPGAVERERLGVGYHYALSRRTKLYADVAHERKIAADRTGYDLGLIVSF